MTTAKHNMHVLRVTLDIEWITVIIQVPIEDSGRSSYISGGDS